jgi:carbamoyl-phosphate synthase large subunit
VSQGRPNIADCLINKEISLIINTPLGVRAFKDEISIRRIALQHHVPCITTLSGAKAAAKGIRALQSNQLSVRRLQDLHPHTNNM